MGITKCLNRLPFAVPGLIVLTLIAALALSGCGPSPVTAGEGYGDVQPLVDQAIADLAQRLDIDAGEIVVRQVMAAEFADTSLGVPQPGQVYAPVLTPGYVILLEMDGRAYEYHAADGRVVLVPDHQSPTPAPDPTEAPPATPEETVPDPSSEGKTEIPADWQTFVDEAYGFRLAYPADWMWRELEMGGAGQPDDWPVLRMVTLFPQAWEEALTPSGPPDPTAKPVVAPLGLEVFVGPEEQFRRAYVEPTRTETRQVNGLTMVIEYEDMGPDFFVARYIFQDPQNPEVRVSLIDYLTGFPERLEGNEALAVLLPAIIDTFEFGE